MEKTLTDLDKFQALVGKLDQHGFRMVSQKEKSQYQEVAKILPPKGRKSRPGQVALLYTHLNGTKVLCWTTFDSLGGNFIGKGLAAAWILILNEKGEARHKSRPIRRVGKFCNRIMYECIINKMRVEGAPWCRCGAKMEIAWNRAFMRGRYWKCSAPWKHRGEKYPTTPLNNGVTGKYLDYVKRRERIRRKYSARRRKEGKDPQYAMKTRKRWVKKD